MPARRHRYGGGYGRLRRRRVRQFAVVAALLLVGTGVFLWVGQDDKPVHDTLTPCPTPSTTAPTSTLQPSQVRLTLLNGTPRNGLAQQVGGLLRARGFVVLRTDNAPAAVAGPSVVTYGVGGLPAATLLARYVPGARVVSGPRAAAGSVQLVLGGSYARLSTPQELAAGTPSPGPVVNARPSNCRA
jgi:hypothetical protein